MIKILPNLFAIISALLVIFIGFLTAKTPMEIFIRLIYIILFAYCSGFLLRFYLYKKVFPENITTEDEKDEDMQKPEGSNMNNKNPETSDEDLSHDSVD